MAQKALDCFEKVSGIAGNFEPFLGAFGTVLKLIHQLKDTHPKVHQERVGRLKKRLSVLDEQLRSVASSISDDEPLHLQQTRHGLEEVLEDALKLVRKLEDMGWIKRFISKDSLDGDFEELNQRLCEHTQALMLSLNIDSHAAKQTFDKERVRVENKTDRDTDLKSLEAIKETLESVKDDTEEIKEIVKETKDMMKNMKSGGIAQQPESPPPVYPGFGYPQPLNMVSPVSSPVQMVSPVSSPVQMVSPMTSPVQMVSPVTTHPLQMPVQMVSPVSSPVQMVSPVTSPVQMVSPVTTHPLQMVSPVTTQPTVVASQSTVVIQETPKTEVVPGNVVIATSKLGGRPTITTCNNCRQRVETKVRYTKGCYAWSMCTLMFCFGIVCGCCLIPLFSKSCKDAHHSCPQCNADLCVHKKCC